MRATRFCGSFYSPSFGPFFLLRLLWFGSLFGGTTPSGGGGEAATTTPPEDFEAATEKRNEPHGIIMAATTAAARPYSSVGPSCRAYLAPASQALGAGHWGVYAGRDYAPDEYVELASRYVVLPKGPAVTQSVLNDYYYGYEWDAVPVPTSSSSVFAEVAFGSMVPYYNHGGRDEQNVRLARLGREPTPRNPTAGRVLAMKTTRPVRRGQELLSSYGNTNIWFYLRNVTVVNVVQQQQQQSQPGRQHPSQQQDEEVRLKRREQRYCSKTYSGIGRTTWKQRIAGAVQRATRDAAEGDPANRTMESATADDGGDDDNIQQLLRTERDVTSAIASAPARVGDVLEIAPVLILSKRRFPPHRSPLAPACVYWNDWDPQQQAYLSRLHQRGAFRRVRGMTATTATTTTRTGTASTKDTRRDTEIIRSNTTIEDDKEAETETETSKSENSFPVADLVLLPVGGNVGMIRKVGRRGDDKDDDDDDPTTAAAAAAAAAATTTTTSSSSKGSNCRLEIVTVTSLLREQQEQEQPEEQAKEVTGIDPNTDDRSIGNDDGPIVSSGGGGLAVRVIATQTIRAGEELRLDLPDSGAWESKIRLTQLLAATGQPIPPHLVAP